MWRSEVLPCTSSFRDLPSHTNSPRQPHVTQSWCWSWSHPNVVPSVHGLDLELSCLVSTHCTSGVGGGVGGVGAIEV